jgi:hypothetical protein
VRGGKARPFLHFCRLSPGKSRPSGCRGDEESPGSRLTPPALTAGRGSPPQVLRAAEIWSRGSAAGWHLPYCHPSLQTGRPGQARPPGPGPRPGEEGDMVLLASASRLTTRFSEATATGTSSGMAKRALGAGQNASLRRRRRHRPLHDSLGCIYRRAGDGPRPRNWRARRTRIGRFGCCGPAAFWEL